MTVTQGTTSGPTQSPTGDSNQDDTHRPGTSGARQRMIASAAEAVTGHDWSSDDLVGYFDTYYEHVPDDDLLNRDPVDLAGIAMSHNELATHREPDQAKVRVFTPTLASHGWQTGHTVIQVVGRDMPFLVDSVTSAVVSLDSSLHLLIHPILRVRRDEQGTLTSLPTAHTGAPVSGEDGQSESWMYVEIDRTDDPGELARIKARIAALLDDVHVSVEDWPQMRAKAEELAASLVGDVPDDLVEEAELATRLLNWLVDDNFTFLGYREYALGGESHDELAVVPGTGLGILREGRDRPSVGGDGLDLTPGDTLVHKMKEKARERAVLILTKANSRSTVHRGTYLDYLGIKTFDSDGQVVGERRFLGLFTSAAYTDSIRRVPMLSEKVDEVLRRSRLSPESHSGRDLLTVMESYPRDELFQASVDDLLPSLTAVMQMQERRRTKVFTRADDYGRFVSAIVYLPRDRFNTAVRLKIEEILRDEFGAATCEYSTHVGESVLARLYFVLRPARGDELKRPDPRQLEARVVDATRGWAEDLADALAHEAGDAESARIGRAWANGFPDSYRADVPARVAVSDLKHVEEALADAEAGRGDLVLRSSLYEPLGGSGDERRFKLFRTRPMSLTTVLPYFRNLGLEVVDERPYELRRDDGTISYIYDFGLRSPNLAGSAGTRASVTEAFEAAWSGRAESDGFDQLVIASGLTWRQVVVVRAYAKYLRQTGTAYSQDYVEQALLTHTDLTRLLVELFEARFDPDQQGTAREPAAILSELLDGLDQVASLDFDRILRAFMAMISATVRTSFYQVASDGSGADEPKSYVAMKIDPRQLPDLPAPRPAHEIWVYSPRVEGVHLRFGAVARGGLRWSDRREDFRTEVLGLVKAQMVKNAVIVPTGAKGGFVAKQLPDSSDREAFMAEGIAAYKIFISALLDVTDDLRSDAEAEGGRRVIPPPRVVRHDGDDPYLVVAADKGTATFSDIANSVSADYGFWLDDAFASGGSAGYDHKAMGITARGAWESVKRHFREMGHDTQTEPFTVVGVGDMSGDVFGNGMLLSDQIRLVAAFDHRHIFLDPDPDPATSFAERQRLFALPRSSWEDYDTSLISAGGGVIPRSAKSVRITPEVAAALGISDAPEKMTPAELLKAVLSAPVDLLWNGGIGTYVKASDQDNASVGDKANDAIRVDGRDLRVKVVGEGGNLGLTQLGRIEAARHGVRVNTDAIDNSAGVDCSDHEVNIKILLGQAVSAGDLTTKQRNELLVQMTDEVADLVLRDNYEQNVLLGNARIQSHSMLAVHQRLMRGLEADGFLDRELEFLPSDSEIAELMAAEKGLSSPEFAVLVAYAKIRLKGRVLDSSIPEEPFFAQRLREYFPEVLLERFGDQMDHHRLRREIIATAVANDLVNRGGITFLHRAVEETGASYDSVVRAYTAAREIFDLPDFVAGVERLDNVVDTTTQSSLYLEFRRLLDRASRWFLHNRSGDIDVAAEIARFAPAAQEWRGNVRGLLVGSELDRVESTARRWSEQGVPTELADRAATLLDEFSLLDVAELAAATDRPLQEVAQVYFAASARYHFDALLGQIALLDREDRWQSLARAALRDDLYHAWMELTRAILTSTEGDDPNERLDAWAQANLNQIERAQATLQEVIALDMPDLAVLSVGLRMLRNVIRTGTGAG
ncbi:MAG: NAD-glutamate dehydrogenase [Actinomycetales bacterium]